MMNLKSWLVLCVFILWSIFCWQWYTCGLKGLCVFGKTHTGTSSGAPDEPSIAHQTDIIIDETITGDKNKPKGNKAKPAPEKIKLNIDKGYTITFGHNSVRKDASDETDTYLNTLADELISNGKKIKITGHTDITENAKLDRQRAWVIKSELMQRGVDPNQIITAGKISSEPVADNTTAWGRHKNRRVVIE